MASWSDWRLRWRRSCRRASSTSGVALNCPMLDKSQNPARPLVSHGPPRAKPEAAYFCLMILPCTHGRQPDRAIVHTSIFR
ncbi:unnamed protein product [Urochloa humidicola]